jgi:hypothetical protein
MQSVVTSIAAAEQRIEPRPRGVLSAGASIVKAALDRVEPLAHVSHLFVGRRFGTILVALLAAGPRVEVAAHAAAAELAAAPRAISQAADRPRHVHQALAAVPAEQIGQRLNLEPSGADTVRRLRCTDQPATDPQSRAIFRYTDRSPPPHGHA